MNDIILMIIEKFGYIGVFLLIAIENIFPPIPSEVILLFSGAMTSNTKLNLVVMGIVSVIGSLLGAYLLYFIGKLFNKERMKTMISGKFGKITKITDDDIDKADDWFFKKGNITVFICRFIPLVRSLISIPAGMNKMNLIKFSIYTILGSMVWNFTLLILGSVVGENWNYIADIFSTYSSVILSILLIIIFLLSIGFYYKKHKGNYKK